MALLISQLTISRRVAVGWTSGLLLLSFLLDSIGRATSGSWVQDLSPFYYYNLNRPLISSFPGSPAAALLLVGLSVLCAGSSLLLFARRDSGRATFSLQRGHSTDTQRVEHSLSQAERNISLRSMGLRALGAESWFAFWWLLGLVSVGLAYVVVLLPKALDLFRQALQKNPTLANLFSGNDTTTSGGLVGTFVFALLPVVVTIFAMTVAMSWTADLENGRLELVLDTPRSRPRIMLERFGATCLLVLLAPIFTWLTVIIGTRIDHISIDEGHVLAASFSMVPPALVIMGLVYVLAGRLRYGAVQGILSAYIALAFLTVFLKGVLQLPDWVLSLSVFYQYGNPMTAGMNWSAFVAPLMDRAVTNAQLTGDLSNGLSAGLRQPDRLTLKLLRVRLLDFLHDPSSPSGIVYPKLSPFHKSGRTSDMLKGQNQSPERSIQKEKQMKHPQQIIPKRANTTLVDVWTGHSCKLAESHFSCADQ